MATEAGWDQVFSSQHLALGHQDAPEAGGKPPSLDEYSLCSIDSQGEEKKARE